MGKKNKADSSGTRPADGSDVSHGEHTHGGGHHHHEHGPNCSHHHHGHGHAESANPGGNGQAEVVDPSKLQYPKELPESPFPPGRNPPKDDPRVKSTYESHELCKQALKIMSEKTPEAEVQAARLFAQCFLLDDRAGTLQNLPLALLAKVELPSTDPMGYVLKAYDCMASGKFVKAVELITSCIKIAPPEMLCRLYEIRADLNMSLSNYRQCLKDIDRAVESAGGAERYSLHLSRGILRAQLGPDYRKAFQDLEFFVDKAHPKDKDLHEAYYALAVLTAKHVPVEDKEVPLRYYMKAREAEKTRAEIYGRSRDEHISGMQRMAIQMFEGAARGKQEMERMLAALSTLGRLSEPPKQPEEKKPAAVPVDVKNPCASCGKANSLKLCGGCKSTAYCSAECQKGHWSSHKAECKILKQGRENAAPAVAVPQAAS